jgi:16S rRNA (uracil1498-N3)-methyltransferase
MPARRFFVENTHAVGDVVELSGSDAHKVARVLRLRTGDRIDVVDSSAQTFDASLIVQDGAVRATLDAVRSAQSTNEPRIDVAQGIPKGSKMDYVVEKLTELGVSTIVPVATERSIVREAGAPKLERWRRLAQAAAQQSGRDTIPAIEEPLDLDRLIERFTGYDVVLFPWELASGEPLRETLPSLVAGAQRVLIVIGPEGGFSHAEAERAAAAGAHQISLGTSILRTETAALVMVAILRYLCS